MDWSDFLQRVDLNKTQGIEINKKRLGKSCLFTLDIDEAKDISIIDAQILLDNKASYFCDAFLELTPFYRDDYNTETMVNVALKLIDDSFRKKYPQERMLLRNSFIHYVKANEFIDYTEISNDIFQKYIQSDACRIEQADKDMFLNKLNELPEKKKFSRQFTRIPKSIKARVIKNDYKLTTFARLEIQDADQNEILAKIKSGSDDDGSTYLKIYTEDQEAIETFKPEQIVRLGE